MAVCLTQSYSGFRVKKLNLPNGWVGRVFGPYDKPKLRENETDSERIPGLAQVSCLIQSKIRIFLDNTILGLVGSIVRRK